MVSRGAARPAVEIPRLVYLVKEAPAEGQQRNGLPGVARPTSAAASKIARACISVISGYAMARHVARAIELDDHTGRQENFGGWLNHGRSSRTYANGTVKRSCEA